MCIRPGLYSHTCAFILIAPRLLILVYLCEIMRRQIAIPNYTRRTGRSLVLSRGLLTGAGLAAYVQALQRRAHAPVANVAKDSIFVSDTWSDASVVLSRLLYDPH